MAQKDDAAAVVRKAWGLFSIYKPHHLYIASQLFITQKNRQTGSCSEVSLVAKNLGRIKIASNKILGKVVEMNFQSLSVN